MSGPCVWGLSAATLLAQRSLPCRDSHGPGSGVSSKSLGGGASPTAPQGPDLQLGVCPGPQLPGHPGWLECRFPVSTPDPLYTARFVCTLKFANPTLLCFLKIKNLVWGPQKPQVRFSTMSTIVQPKPRKRPFCERNSCHEADEGSSFGKVRPVDDAGRLTQRAECGRHARRPHSPRAAAAPRGHCRPIGVPFK